MPGIHEIVLIALVVLTLLVLSRSGNRRIPSAGKPRRIAGKRVNLSGKLRLALLATVLWPATAAAVFKPWAGGGTLFLLIGILPVIALWGIGWVVGPLVGGAVLDATGDDYAVLMYTTIAFYLTASVVMHATLRPVERSLESGAGA